MCGIQYAMEVGALSPFPALYVLPYLSQGGGVRVEFAVRHGEGGALSCVLNCNVPR